MVLTLNCIFNVYKLVEKAFSALEERLTENSQRRETPDKHQHENKHPQDKRNSDNDHKGNENNVNNIDVMFLKTINIIYYIHITIRYIR